MMTATTSAGPSSDEIRKRRQLQGAKSAHPASLVAIYAVFFVLGLLSIVRSLPFGCATLR
jgi:hypothetical protein